MNAELYLFFLSFQSNFSKEKKNILTTKRKISQNALSIYLFSLSKLRFNLTLHLFSNKLPLKPIN